MKRQETLEPFSRNDNIETLNELMLMKMNNINSKKELSEMNMHMDQYMATEYRLAPHRRYNQIYHKQPPFVTPKPGSPTINEEIELVKEQQMKRNKDIIEQQRKIIANQQQQIMAIQERQDQLILQKKTSSYVASPASQKAKQSPYPTYSSYSRKTSKDGSNQAQAPSPADLSALRLQNLYAAMGSTDRRKAPHYQVTQTQLQPQIQTQIQKQPHPQLQQRQRTIPKSVPSTQMSYSHATYHEYDDINVIEKIKAEGYVHRITKRYVLQANPIAKGSFGQVFLALDLESGKKVACKLEQLDIKVPQLLREAKILKLLSNSRRAVGIPRVYFSGRIQNHNAMVMDYLGPSLENLRANSAKKRFSTKSILMLADQMLRKVEYVHSRGILHRDIKPDNFLIGRKDRSHIIYIVDFGLSKQYMDTHHIPYRDNKSLTGTARYASINNHIGVEQSRRDDLESLAFVLLYLYRGKLPWQGLPIKGPRETRYKAIADQKYAYGPRRLCKGLPSCFHRYLSYVRSLGFTDQPNYSGCRRYFRDVFEERGYEMDFVFDWTTIKPNV